MTRAGITGRTRERNKTAKRPGKVNFLVIDMKRLLHVDQRRTNYNFFQISLAFVCYYNYIVRSCFDVLLRAKGNHSNAPINVKPTRGGGGGGVGWERWGIGRD